MFSLLLLLVPGSKVADGYIFPEPLARGSLFDELEDEFGSTRQAQPVLIC